MSNGRNVAVNTAKAMATRVVLKKLNLATLKIQLIIGGILLAIIILVVFISGIIATIGGGTTDESQFNNPTIPGSARVSPEVAQYKGAVFDELSKYNLSQYTELLLALMMQESGGRGNDPMQASESYCGYIGCITDPQLSIEQGVYYFTQVLEQANYDVPLALQSYNFGLGFITYVMQNGGSYSKELAISFSQMMYETLKHTGIYRCHRPEAIQYQACYGDIGYVDAVMRYLPTLGVDSPVIDGDLNSPLDRDLHVTSPFGWRDLGFGPEFHKGVDFRCNESNSVHSIKDGKIVYAGWSNGYGNLVTVQHGDYDYSSYAHLDRIDVSNGQQVNGGSQLGMCGNTGRSLGSHLHFEIKTEMWGGQMDPAQFLGLGG